MELKRRLVRMSLVGPAAILFFAAGTLASGSQTTVLYKFTGVPDGRSPNGQLIADHAGKAVDPYHHFWAQFSTEITRVITSSIASM